VALTALAATGGRIDGPFCSDLEWASLYRVRPRLALACPDCGGRVHAKQSSQGLRFFAHDTAASGCSAGESVEHMELKVVLAAAARGLGWSADLEFAESDWRADVLTTNDLGRRVALEVQLSAMSVADGQSRTDRYRRDGVEVIWFRGAGGATYPPWFATLPSASLTRRDGIWVVDGPCARLRSGVVGSWENSGPIPLAKFLRAVGNGKLVFETGRVSAWVKQHDLAEHHRQSGEQQAWELHDADRWQALAATQRALLARVKSAYPLPNWNRWWTITSKRRPHACRGMVLARGQYKTVLTRVALIEPTVIDHSLLGLPIWATPETAALLRGRYGSDLAVHIAQL
jgi:hypothetical protein